MLQGLTTIGWWCGSTPPFDGLFQYLTVERVTDLRSVQKIFTHRPDIVCCASFSSPSTLSLRSNKNFHIYTHIDVNIFIVGLTLCLPKMIKFLFEVIISLEDSLR